VALALVVLAACSTGIGSSAAATGRLDDTSPGPGVFTFRAPGALHDHPVQVWYRMPRHPSTARVLVVMPGQQRDARRYRSEWTDPLRGKNVILLVPQFADDEFSGPEAYNVGNMIDRNGDAVDPSLWSFRIVEALFKFVVARTHNNASGYLLFGHSAGAQFVHRMIEFQPTNHVRRAVAANAGWYTVVDDSVDFPYGLDHGPRREHEMGDAFRSDLVVLLGADDIDPHDSSLRRDAQSDEQGETRLERGFNFYLTAREAADEHDLAFRWRLQVTPGVAHSDGDIAPVAARLLLGR
jgi:hypothetical protein